VQQSLQPLAPARPQGPPTWIRWVIGPVISVVTAGVTYAAAGALLPKHKVVDVFQPPPPPPTQMGKIKLDTSPPGASVTVDGKPHNHFTPTEIEGPVGETATRIVVKLDGYHPKEQDVLFAASPQRLSLILEKVEAPPEPKKGKHGKEKLSITAVGDKGTVGIFVEPEASVVIDGKGVGRTPLGSVTLSPGPHTIELINDKVGKHETVRVDIKAGENPAIKRHW
jgi:hypothetical protein